MPEDTEIDPIVQEAKERFQLCVDSESTERQRQLDDLRFLDGEQWSEQAKNERARDRRPAHVVNRLDQFVQHITNEMRQNRVGAKVFPVDDNADPETADIIQGLLRHIEYTSKADIAYDTAAFYAVAMGMGYYRILSDYCDPMSFDQEIKIERVSNPFQVYLGPHEMPDGSDAQYGFLFTDLSREEYKSEFPKSELSLQMDWTTVGNAPPDWLSKDGARVVEYYKIERSPDELIRFQDGSTFLKSQLPEDFDESKIAVNPKTKEQVRRETSIPIVHWYKINAVEVLAKTVWPGCYIPIPKMTGNELNVDGKRTLKGIVRNMKDAQRQYNVMLSAQTEAIDSDKGQVVVVEGQLEGHEAEWRKMNAQKVLQVKGKTINGQPAPMPSRLAANASIAAMNEARMMAGDDLKALTSLYDASLGAQSNETSGRAIGARQQQSETANFHFSDNKTRTITHGSKIILDAIPTYYNTPDRIVRIIGDDDTHRIEKVNQILQDGQEGNAYKLDVGKYDLICTADKSFATRKRESAEKLTSLVQVAPGLMNVVPDFIMKAQDIPYADEMAERLKKTLPPGIADDDEKNPIPPQAQQAISQLQQQNQQLTQHLEMATEEYQTEKQKADHNIALEEKKFANAKELALIDRETQLLKIEATIDAQAAKATMEAEIQQIHAELDAIRGKQAVEHGAEVEKDKAEHGAIIQKDVAEHGSGLAMEQAEHAQSIAPSESEGAE